MVTEEIRWERKSREQGVRSKEREHEINPELIGQNLGRVFNSKRCCMYDMH